MILDIDGPAPCRFCGGAFEWSSEPDEAGLRTWTGVCKCGCEWELMRSDAPPTWRDYAGEDRCVLALLGEVDRLRAELERARAERDDACVELVNERGDTVAWLREVAETMNHNGDKCCGRVEDLADAVARGEHRREEVKP